MPNPISSSDIRHYAIVGAEARLLQLSQETETIHRLFPELRNGAPERAEPAAASPRRQARRGRGRTMSTAERNAVSEHMKKYWAARRGGGDTGTTSSDSPVKAAKAARRERAKRSPRTMSPEARKRISDAQKARWAAHRGGAKATSASESEAATAGTRKARSAKGRPRGAKRGPRKVSAAARKRMSQAQKKRWAAKRKAA